MVRIFGYTVAVSNGHSNVLQNTGLRIWMLELLYDKYCAPFDIPRVTSFYTCVWLKHYPHDALLLQFSSSVFRTWLPLEPLPHTFIGISNYRTFLHSNMWPAVLGYHDGIWWEVMVHLPL